MELFVAMKFNSHETPPTSQMTWSRISARFTASPFCAYQRCFSMKRGSTLASRSPRSSSAMRMRQGTTLSRKKLVQPSNSTINGISSGTSWSVCHSGGLASLARRNQ